MKIVHLASGTIWWGGVQKHILDLATEQRRLGHEVTIACPSDSAIERRALDQGIRTVRVAMWHSHQWWRLPRYLRATAGYDILHAHYPDDYIVPAVAAHLARVRAVILTRHSPHHFRSRLTAFICSRLMFDSLIAVSESVRDVLVRSGASSDRVFVVHNGIHPADYHLTPEVRNRLRSELQIPENALLVVAAGRLSPEKGYSTLIRAAALSKNRGRLFVAIAGRGPEASALQKVSEEVGMWDQVRLAGFQARMPDFYAAADIVAVPSIFESFGYSALEALASGRPVVASRVGGLPEIVTEDCGLLFPPEDFSALAQALDLLADNEDFRLRLGAAGRIRAAQFDISSMAKSVNRIYLRVLHG